MLCDEAAHQQAQVPINPLKDCTSILIDRIDNQNPRPFGRSFPTEGACVEVWELDSCHAGGARDHLGDDEGEGLQGGRDAGEARGEGDGGVEVRPAVVPRRTHHRKVDHPKHDRRQEVHPQHRHRCTWRHVWPRHVVQGQHQSGRQHRSRIVQIGNFWCCIRTRGVVLFRRGALE